MLWWCMIKVLCVSLYDVLVWGLKVLKVCDDVM